MGPLCPCPNSKKPMKKVPGASHGPPTDPEPSGSTRVSKWSVRPWLRTNEERRKRPRKTPVCVTPGDNS
ncbi:unnamed protein product [Staurois parvus]|uniref:Uncharacterized protein n=1 Tax=Staurois parvus TaxID=386267 RepID=A0ABN9CDV5_9NEOB|nr:unnamed protein product [Staurois parvus]